MRIPNILSFILAVCAYPIFAHPCTDYLQPEKVPWIDAVLINRPFVHMESPIGELAFWKGRPVVARPCGWCPDLASREEAEKWLKNEPMGQRTRDAYLSLAQLSKKNYADNFYGLKWSQGKIYFVSKPPEGSSLSAIIAGSAPRIYRHPPGEARPRGTILPKHVQEIIKIRGLLNSPKSNFPFPLVTYATHESEEELTLLEFLEAMEWNFTPDGKIRLSAYHLEKLYSVDGELKKPLIFDAEDIDTVGYGNLLLMTTTILNSKPELAWRQLLNGKVLDFFALPDYIRQVKQGPWKDPLLQKLHAGSLNWDPVAFDRLLYTWEAGEMQHAGTVQFASRELLQEHFIKHGAEFKTTSAEEYLAAASRFLAGQNVGEELGIDSKNRRVGYRRISNGGDEYVILDPDADIVVVTNLSGNLRTFFRLASEKSGMDLEQYLVEQARKDLTSVRR